MPPWPRNALQAAGLTQRGVAALVPGWHLHGRARHAAGPWTYFLMSGSEVTPAVTVQRVADMRDAIAGLVASVTPDLEMQLAASLALLEDKA